MVRRRACARRRPRRGRGWGSWGGLGSIEHKHRLASPLGGATPRHLGRLSPVTHPTEGLVPVEPALAPTLDHRHNVVGLPLGPVGFVAVLIHPLAALGVGIPSRRRFDETPERLGCRGGIDTAPGTHPVVPLSDLLANVPGVGPEPVLVDACVAAERPPALPDLLVTPPAEWATTRASRTAPDLPPRFGCDASRRPAHRPTSPACAPLRAACSAAGASIPARRHLPTVERATPVAAVMSVSVASG